MMGGLIKLALVFREMLVGRSLDDWCHDETKVDVMSLSKNIVIEKV